MHRLAEICNQEYAVEPLLIGKIPQPLIGIFKNHSQFRIIIVNGTGNREL